MFLPLFFSGNKKQFELIAKAFFFWGKKKIVGLSSTEFAQRVVKVKSADENRRVSVLCLGLLKKHNLSFRYFRKADDKAISICGLPETNLNKVLATRDIKMCLNE